MLRLEFLYTGDLLPRSRCLPDDTGVGESLRREEENVRRLSKSHASLVALAVLHGSLYSDLVAIPRAVELEAPFLVEEFVKSKGINTEEPGSITDFIPAIFVEPSYEINTTFVKRKLHTESHVGPSVDFATDSVLDEFYEINTQFVKRRLYTETHVGLVTDFTVSLGVEPVYEIEHRNFVSGIHTDLSWLGSEREVASPIQLNTHYIVPDVVIKHRLYEAPITQVDWTPVRGITVHEFFVPAMTWKRRQLFFFEVGHNNVVIPGDGVMPLGIRLKKNGNWILIGAP